MSLYEFKCPRCGPFQVRRAFSDVGATTPCPVCGASATRVFSPPNLRRVPPAVAAALAREERSRHEPEVVHRAGSEEPLATPQPHRVHGRPWQVGH